jgi:CheY-like chemotaxis protein
MRSKKRILICDDTEHQFSTLKAILENDYDVRRSGHYKNVLDDIRKLSPVHLLILDLGFGYKDYVGHKCVPDVTQEFPNLKIIVFSSILTDLEHQDLALEIARELVHYPQVVGFLSPADPASKVLFDVHKALGTSDWLQDGESWLLHISDIQFGGEGLPDDGEMLANSIGETIQSFVDAEPDSAESGRRRYPFLAMLTGDLTEHGRPEEFKEVSKFVNTLSQILATQRPEMQGLLRRQNVITIPGNHDINWDISIAQNLHRKKNRQPTDPPFEFVGGRENCRPELEFLKRYSWAPYCESKLGVHDDDMYWPVDPGFKIINLKNELKIVFILVNSSLWGVDHVEQKAEVPIRIWQEIKTRLKSADPNREAARILLVHHSLASGVSSDDQLKLTESSSEPDQLIDKLSRTCNISLMFTGHIHRLAACDLDTTSNDRTLINIGAGTARSKDRRENCNPQFNIVKLGDISDDNKYKRVIVFPFHFDGTRFCSYAAFGDGMKNWKSFDLRY